MDGQPVARASKTRTPSERDSPDPPGSVPYVDAAEAETRRLAQDVDGEVLVLVPGHRVRGQVFLGEVQGRLDDRELVVGEERGHGAHPMVGIVKLAPSRIPEAGQREVTVLVRV